MNIGNKKHQSGFTIIELLIATTVFSMVLLIVTTGVVRIGQAYYKNLTLNRTQDTTRSISDDISRSIQFAGGQRRAGASANQFCIGDVRYTYNINQKVSAGAAGLSAERITPTTACNSPSGPSVKELLSEDMRLLRFKVNPVDPLARTWRVDIRVAYGDNDLLSHYNNDGSPKNPANILTDADTANCKSGIDGSSFCATSQLDTLVKRRLN